MKRIPGFVGVNNSLVDMGCGDGAVLDLIRGEMAHCLGIDRNPPDRPGFLRGDIEGATVNGYDRLISFEVIEHLKSEESVAMFAKTLNRHGLAAISVPNKWWLFETHGSALAPHWPRIPLLSWAPEWFRRICKVNARIYTKGSIYKLMEASGFHVLSMAYVTAPMDVLPAGWVRNALRRYVFRGDTTPWPWLATSIFVVARKA